MRRRSFVVAGSVALTVVAASVLLLASRSTSLVELTSKLRGSLTAKMGDRVQPKIELTPFEQQVLDEINLARANPKQYASYLEQWKQSCAGNNLKLDAKRTVTLNEGAKAIDEAIQFLRAAQPLPALTVAQGMTSGAKDHVLDLTRTGASGHRGSDGSLPDQRVNRYGSYQGAVAENIAYAAATAREAVLGMIVDDGVPARGHRLNLFNPVFRTAGIASGSRADGLATCVIDFAGGYVEHMAAAAGSAKMIQ
jgi:uncharacterized protein YkwD